MATITLVPRVFWNYFEFKSFTVIFIAYFCCLLLSLSKRSVSSRATWKIISEKIREKRSEKKLTTAGVLSLSFAALLRYPFARRFSRCSPTTSLEKSILLRAIGHITLIIMFNIQWYTSSHVKWYPQLENLRFTFARSVLSHLNRITV